MQTECNMIIKVSLSDAHIEILWFLCFAFVDSFKLAYIKLLTKRCENKDIQVEDDDVCVWVGVKSLGIQNLYDLLYLSLLCSDIIMHQTFSCIKTTEKLQFVVGKKFIGGSNFKVYTYIWKNFTSKPWTKFQTVLSIKYIFPGG